jgi:hypothetical protein
LLCIIDNQCSNFASFSIKIVESKMTTNRFVLSKRSIASMSTIISAIWFTNDENDTNDDVIEFLTLRVRSWAVSRIFSFCFIVRRINFWSISSFCKVMFFFWRTLFFSRYSFLFVIYLLITSSDHCNSLSIFDSSSWSFWSSSIACLKHSSFRRLSLSQRQCKLIARAVNYLFEIERQTESYDDWFARSNKTNSQWSTATRQRFEMIASHET